MFWEKKYPKTFAILLRIYAILGKQYILRIKSEGGSLVSSSELKTKLY